MMMELYMVEHSKLEQTSARMALPAVPATLYETQQRLLDELRSFQPDVTLLPDNPSATSLTFAQTFASYLTGACSLSAASEAWEAYKAEVEAKPLGPLEYRRPPSAPKELETYARSLSGETASLDVFTRRVLDLSMLVGYFENYFLRECETQGPIGAIYDYLCESGLDATKALSLLLHDHSVYHIRLFRESVPTSQESDAAPQANALGHFLLTLLPDRLSEITQILGRPKAPDRFRHNLPALVTFLGTYPEDHRYLPLAWQVARQAPPLLVGVCARILLDIDPAGFDSDFLAQTGLSGSSSEGRLAACRMLLDAECDIFDDLLEMREVLWVPRRWTGSNPLDVAIPAWLEQSSPLLWWMPLLSAVADPRVFPLLGKGPGVNFWRELGKMARRRVMLIEIWPGIRGYLTRNTFLRAYQRRTSPLFDQVARCLDTSVSAVREALMPRLGFDNQGSRILDYGGSAERHFSVRVGIDGTLQLADMTGKSLRALPAPAAEDDPAQVAQARQAVKILKQQIQWVMEAGAEILQQAYEQHRSWQLAQWHAIYMMHPILRMLAMRVIWQVTSSSGLPIRFRPRGDGKLIGASAEPVQLPEQGEITLLPADTLDRADHDAWQAHLDKHQVLPLLDQLSVISS
jgi:hypothetical protein